MSIKVSCDSFLEKIKKIEKCPKIHYYHCQWEPKTNHMTWIYLLYKWFHFLAIFIIFTTTVVLELKQKTGTWFKYFSHWSMIVYVFESAVGVYIMTDNQIFGDSALTIIDVKPVLCRLYRVFQSCSVTVALSLSIARWSPNWYDGMKFNIMNVVLSPETASLIMGLDFIMISHSIKLKDIIFPLFWAIIYFQLTLIIYLFESNRAAPSYIHEAIRWDSPMLSIKSFLYYFAIEICTYIVLWILSIALRKISRTILPEIPIEEIQHNDNEPNTEQDAESKENIEE